MKKGLGKVKETTGKTGNSKPPLSQAKISKHFPQKYRLKLKGNMKKIIHIQNIVK